MSDLPLTQPKDTPEINSIETPSPAPISSKPNWLNPKYLWQQNRWLFVAYISVVVIALLGMGLVGLFVYNQISQNKTDAEPKTTQGSNQPPATTRKSDDDDFFAKQPLTILYYSFAQTSSSKNMFQATPSDQENRIIEIGFPDKYQFSTSPNGSWLLRWNDKSLERSSAAEPQKFTSIFDVSDDKTKISSVVWQNDGDAVAIATRQLPLETSTDQPRNSIVVLPILTLQSVEVHEEVADYEIELIKFPTANELYYYQNRDGVKQNLTQFNPQSKKVERQLTAINQPDLIGKLQYSADMNWAYRTTETQVIRYNLESMEQTVVYSTNRQCEIGEPNNNAIAYASVSPSGDKLLVTENLSLCPRQPRSQSTQPTPVPPTSQTTIYSVSEQKNISRQFNLDLPQVESSSWSPGENFVALTLDTQRVYIATISDLKLSPLPSLDRYNLTKERVFVIGWIKSGE